EIFDFSNLQPNSLLRASTSLLRVSFFNLHVSLSSISSRHSSQSFASDHFPARLIIAIARAREQGPAVGVPSSMPASPTSGTTVKRRWRFRDALGRQHWTEPPPELIGRMVTVWLDEPEEVVEM
ncbi:hypothetical protein Droror1_Dr00025195, partial [Drosera rotundifolia]